MRLCPIRTSLTAALAALAIAPLARADPSAPAPTPALAPAPAPDWVTITLASDDPHAALYARAPHKLGLGDDVVDSWSFVCLAPCGAQVDPHRAYRVMGEALVPSIEFNLAPGSGSVALVVHARHPASSAVTATLAIVGGVSALGGVLMLLLDLAEHGAASAVSSDPRSRKKLDGTADTYGNVGAGLLAGGVVFGSAALIYLLTAGKTDLAPAAPTDKARSGSRGLSPIPSGFAF